jgi:hypothetical protein
MNKRVIVKVQTPLAQSSGEPLALIYDQSRKVQTQIPVTPELLAQMGGEPKRFFYAVVSGEGITLGRPAPFQDW